MTEFAMAIMCLSFCDIARNRNRCTSYLISKAVDLLLRKAVGKFIDFRNHIHGFLPHHEIFEMLSHRRTVFWVLVTEYWVLPTHCAECASHPHPARCSPCLPGAEFLWRGHSLLN